jgi:hypothetical protein
LPIRKAIITIVLMLGYWAWVGAACGQEDRPGGSRPDRPSLPADDGDGADAEPRQQLQRMGAKLTQLSQGQAQARTGPRSEIDRLKEQVELQQKQIDVLLKMTQLLAGQVKKQPATAAELATLQEQAVTLDARLQQGARRDQELARARDDVLE